MSEDLSEQPQAIMLDSAENSMAEIGEAFMAAQRAIKSIDRGFPTAAECEPILHALDLISFKAASATLRFREMQRRWNEL